MNSYHEPLSYLWRTEPLYSTGWVAAAFLFVGLAGIGCGADPTNGLEAECTAHCPVGAASLSTESMTGECTADGGYRESEGATVSGSCIGTGVCRIACVYPKCEGGRSLVITEAEYRCEEGAGNPCGSVDCSNHGICRVVNDVALCVCDKGFTSNGAHCDVDERPIISTVTPASATVGAKTEFVVVGQNLPDTLLVDVDGCSGLSVTQRGDAQQKFLCTPTRPGPASRMFYPSAAGEHLFSDEAMFVCTGCAVGGSCYEPGETRSGNPCLVCDPMQSPLGWSFNDDVACDDGIFCNGSDQCSEGACSGHVATPCQDDGVFCNGSEVCVEGSKTCSSLGNPCVDDAVYCNGPEICDEENDTCSHEGSPCPDDGLYCNGKEYCDVVLGKCTRGESPCSEDGNFCNGIELCDDQTNTCSHSGDPCPDDGLFCNGPERCDGWIGKCVHGGSPCLDDLLFCNGTEFCDEAADGCGSTGTPCPDDALFCNGAEYCDPSTSACAHSGSPCVDDGLVCNGAEYCSEDGNECLHTGNPCNDNGVFCDGLEFCNSQTNQCQSSGDPCPEDGVFCNGTEWCNEQAAQCERTALPCRDDGIFCNGIESCDEVTSGCWHSGSPCIDNGVFCDGAESCDPVSDACFSDGMPCAAGTFCSNEFNQCFVDRVLTLPSQGSANRPEVYVWADGYSVVVWEFSPADGSDSTIQAQVFDPTGTPVTGVVTVGADVSLDQEPRTHPSLSGPVLAGSVVPESMDYFLVAWSGSGAASAWVYLERATGAYRSMGIHAAEAPSFPRIQEDNDSNPLLLYHPGGGASTSILRTTTNGGVDLYPEALLSQPPVEACGGSCVALMTSDGPLSAVIGPSQIPGALWVTEAGNVVLATPPPGLYYYAIHSIYEGPKPVTGLDAARSQNALAEFADVVWSLDISEAGVTTWGIQGMRLDGSYEPVTDQTVLASGPGTLGGLRMGHTQAGSFVLVWSQKSADTLGWDVFVQPFAHPEFASGPATRVNAESATDDIRPDVATNVDGHTVVTWESVGADGVGTVHVRFYPSGNL